jgi:hypothetical protein
LLQAFKVAYDAKLASFMTVLKAVKPANTEDPGTTAARVRISDASRQARMFADPKRSFVRPDWVDLGTAPNMAQVHTAQEDLWLMEDLVAILAEANDDFLKQAMAKDKAATADISWAPIKELVEIRIGGDAAALAGGKASSGAVRYAPAAKGAAAKAGSLGRSPLPGFYAVLPYRLDVVVDARYYGEVIRRLKDRETFLTVQSWRVTPIVTEALLARNTKDLLALTLDDYGRREEMKDDRRETQTVAVVRLEVVGDSLAWTMDGGRVLW